MSWCSNFSLPRTPVPRETQPKNHPALIEVDTLLIRLQAAKIIGI